jgi:hypothetical protein
MKQKLQMQMMTMFGQQISSDFGNDPCQSTSGKPATNGSGDATENSRNLQSGIKHHKTNQQLLCIPLIQYTDGFNKL